MKRFIKFNFIGFRLQSSAGEDLRLKTNTFKKPVNKKSPLRSIQLGRSFVSYIKELYKVLHFIIIPLIQLFFRLPSVLI